MHYTFFQHLQINRSLYGLIGYLLLPIILLRLLLKSIRTPEYRQRIGERLGLIHKIPVPTIWLHCVSVGEFRAATVLIDKLIEQYPNYRVLVTTTTVTGSQAVKNHYQSAVLHFYFPFDLPFVASYFVKQMNAQICILLETEIWPNVIHALNKNNIPALLVNARLSQRSLLRYKKITPKLAKQTLNKFSLIATQNQNSANRFVKLGANTNKVLVAGNLKFEQNIKADVAVSKTLKTLIGKRKVVVFASTHKGEEAQIIKKYLTHKNNIDALMVIVPRHPQRFNEVYKLAQKHNINMIKRSNGKFCKDAEMLLGDSMGEMMAYFDNADIVFMGGSLNNTGGHNILEPAALGKPILFGANMFNFAEISADLLEQQAAIQVKNTNELFKQIMVLLNDEQKSKKLGENAKAYFESKQGAVDNIMSHIQDLLV